MKIKSLLIIALTTSVILGTIADPAEARRRSRYSSRGQDQSAVGATFNLFDRTINTKGFEQPIIDSDADPNIDFFEGAIENYFATLDPGDVSNFPNGFVEDILLPQGDSLPIANLKARRSGDNIVYEILRQGDNFVVEDFILDLKKISNDSFSTTVLKLVESGEYDLDAPLNPNNTLTIPKFDISRAINDITYILDNNLLVATLPSKIPTDQLNPNPDTVFQATDGINLPLDNTNPPTDNTKVPESSTINTLLILGTLGTGLLLKRKIKNNMIYSAKL
jgi:hypothetical protein